MKAVEYQSTFDKVRKFSESFDKQFKDFMTEKGNHIFTEIFKEIFEKYPDIDSFSWTQYTPYFNDGDECIFSINSVDTINGYDEYNDEDEQQGVGKNYFEYVNDKRDPENVRTINDIDHIIQAIPAELLRNMFGDHCRVVVKRSGISTETYDHE